MTHVEHAHAKLTVYLHMTGVRDDGMHLIDAEMVSLDLADTLEFTDGDGLETRGLDEHRVPIGDDNIVRKALSLVGRTAHVKLTKRIPIGGGLGGGSADAAAALRWAGFDDPVEAARIGADVAFCLRGGRARVRGIGEILEPLEPLSRSFTLLLPPFGVNTAAVYREFDRAATRFDVSVVNHLEVAAIAVEPRLAIWRDRFAAWTGRAPVLAGSGSTWFVEGVFDTPSVQELADARWIVTHTV